VLYGRHHGVTGLQPVGNDWFRVDEACRLDYAQILEGECGLTLYTSEAGTVITDLKVHLSHLPLLPGFEYTAVPLGSEFISKHHPQWWVDELRDYQRADAIWHRQRVGSINASGLGVGKTRVGLAAADPPLMIVCPTTAYGVWTDELDYIGWDWECLYGETVDFDLLENRKPQAWIISYHLVPFWGPFFNHSGSGGSLACKIADEGHVLHRGRTGWTKGWRAVEAAREIMLTATPIRNYRASLFSLLDSICSGAFGWRGKFRVDYCGAERGEWGLVDAPAALIDEDVNRKLASRLSQVVVQRTRKDAGQVLPPIRRKMKRVKLAKDVLFDALKNLLITYDADVSLAWNTASRQFVGKMKAEARKDYIADLIIKWRRGVVWVWHKSVTKILRKAFEAAGIEVTVIDGSTKQSLRDEISHEWKTGDVDPDVPQALIASIGAASEAVSFTSCGLSIFVEMDYLPSKMQQAEARVHRFAQKNSKCLSIYFVLKDTIDERIGEILLAKAQENDLLTSNTMIDQVKAMIGFEEEPVKTFLQRVYTRKEKKDE